MKPVYLLSALLFFSLRAQAPVPVPLARGDAPGEPHHHLKIENAYVRAYYVEVPPHAATQLHQHDNDYMFVTLGDSDVTNAVLGKPEVHLQLKDGEVRFTRGGFAHVARNNSGAPFRNVTIEFLLPQSAARNLCEEIIPGGDRGPCESSTPSSPRGPTKGFSISPAFETGETRVEGASLAPKTAHAELAAGINRLLVALNQVGMDVKFTHHGRINLHAGELLWIPAEAKVAFLNRGRSTSRFLLICFKDTIPAHSVLKDGFCLPARAASGTVSQ